MTAYPARDWANVLPPFLPQCDAEAISEGKVKMNNYFKDDDMQELVHCPYTTGEYPWSKHHSHDVRGLT